MTPIPPIPEDLQAIYDRQLNSYSWVYVKYLIERIAKLTAEVERHTLKATEFMYERDEARAENTRLKAPVSQRQWLMAQHEGDHMSTNPSRCARIATAIIRSRATRTPPQEGQ